MAGQVYCLRARNRVASAARWRPDVLPYLGPEIIAVIQAAPSFAPNDSRTGARLLFRKSDDTVIPPVVFFSSLRCSDSGTVGVLNVLVHIEWLPLLRQFSAWFLTTQPGDHVTAIELCLKLCLWVESFDILRAVRSRCLTVSGDSSHFWLTAPEASVMCLD